MSARHPLSQSEVWTNPDSWHSAVDLVGKTALGQQVDAERTEALSAAAAFERKLDPSGSLPGVRLESVADRQYLSHGWLTYDVFDNGGQQIGYCNLCFHSDGKAYISEVMLGRTYTDKYIRSGSGEFLDHENLLGKGYGRAIYKSVISEALQQGYGFKNSDGGLSKMGYEFWLKLVEKGVAKIVDPGDIQPGRGHYSYSNARFEILSPDELLQA